MTWPMGASPLPRPPTCGVACAISAALALGVVAGCGSSSGRSASRHATPAASFPAVNGRSLAQLRAGAPESYVLAPSVSLLSPGTNRFGFALFDPSHKMIEKASVALYVSDARGGHVRGPFPARSESLAVQAPFQSRTVASDPDAAHSVYVADIPLVSGKPVVTALVSVAGHRAASTEDQFQVPVRGAQPPMVGQAAISVHTPTVASVGGNAGQIDTRTPPATDLQQVDFARVLGHRPVVLTFATPQLCQSRVCGPVVDIAEQVRSQAPPSVAFVHVEIYKNNTVSNGFLPQVTAWHLPTEPWTFVIDRRGAVATRFEGAFSAQELAAAVRRVQ